MTHATPSGKLGNFLQLNGIGDAVKKFPFWLLGYLALLAVTVPIGFIHPNTVTIYFEILKCFACLGGALYLLITLLNIILSLLKLEIPEPILDKAVHAIYSLWGIMFFLFPVIGWFFGFYSLHILISEKRNHPIDIHTEVKPVADGAKPAPVSEKQLEINRVSPPPLSKSEPKPAIVRTSESAPVAPAPSQPIPMPEIPSSYNSFRSVPRHRFIVPKTLDEERLERARTEYMHFPNGCCEGSNLIETLGEESPYYVSPYDCTCKSFKYGRAPCKHMYRLWIELGYLE